MSDTPEKDQTTPAADGGKQTKLDPEQRKTGQGTSMDTRDGAEAEAPGARNDDVPGSPNQGTDAR